MEKKRGREARWVSRTMLKLPSRGKGQEDNGLAFKVNGVSSEDARALGLVGGNEYAGGKESKMEQLEGWCTGRACEWPQECVVELESCCKVWTLEIQVHEFRVPNRIAIYALGQRDPGEMYIGHVEFTSNLYDYSRQEIKAVPIYAYCTGIRIVVEGCHRNKFNVYQQAQIVKLNVNGQPSPLIEESPAAIPERIFSGNPWNPENEVESKEFDTASVAATNNQETKEASQDIERGYVEMREGKIAYIRPRFEVVDDAWIHDESYQHGAMTDVDLALLSVGVPINIISDSASRIRVDSYTAACVESLLASIDQVIVHYAAQWSGTTAIALDEQELDLIKQAEDSVHDMLERGIDRAKWLQAKLDRLEERDNGVANQAYDQSEAIKQIVEQIFHDAEQCFVEYWQHKGPSEEEQPINDWTNQPFPQSSRSQEAEQVEETPIVHSARSLQSSPKQSSPRDSPRTFREQAEAVESTSGSPRIDDNPFQTRDKTPRTPPPSELPEEKLDEPAPIKEEKEEEEEDVVPIEEEKLQEEQTQVKPVEEEEDLVLQEVVEQMSVRAPSASPRRSNASPRRKSPRKGSSPRHDSPRISEEKKQEEIECPDISAKFALEKALETKMSEQNLVAVSSAKVKPSSVGFQLFGPAIIKWLSPKNPPEIKSLAWTQVQSHIQNVMLESDQSVQADQLIEYLIDQLEDDVRVSSPILSIIKQFLTAGSEPAKASLHRVGETLSQFCDQELEPAIVSFWTDISEAHPSTTEVAWLLCLSLSSVVVSAESNEVLGAMLKRAENPPADEHLDSIKKHVSGTADENLALLIEGLESKSPRKEPAPESPKQTKAAPALPSSNIDSKPSIKREKSEWMSHWDKVDEKKQKEQNEKKDVQTKQAAPDPKQAPLSKPTAPGKSSACIIS